MKKIILFTDSLVGGGAQRQLVTLATNIDRQKFNPVVVIYHDLQDFRPLLDHAGVRVEYVQKHRKIDITFLWRLVRLFRIEQPDIILSYLTVPNIWARLAGRLAGVECIITSERNIDIEHSRTKVFIEKLLHRYSSLVVVNAEAIKDLLIKIVGVPEAKLKVIYNGVDIDQFSLPNSDAMENYRIEFGLHATDKIILLPGRMTPQKNHICLVHAFCSIAKIIPNTKLLFVGEELYKDIKDEIIQELVAYDLLGRVVFAGRQTEMRELYSLSDIIVLPSLWEGFPNVILEAMASERAVIASDVADNRRLVYDGVNGYLFEVGDNQKLANLLLRILASGDNAITHMGMKGKEIISEFYSVSVMIENYQNMFDSFDENLYLS